MKTDALIQSLDTLLADALRKNLYTNDTRYNTLLDRLAPQAASEPSAPTHPDLVGMDRLAPNAPSRYPDLVAMDTYTRGAPSAHPDLVGMDTFNASQPSHVDLANLSRPALQPPGAPYDLAQESAGLSFAPSAHPDLANQSAGLILPRSPHPDLASQAASHGASQHPDLVGQEQFQTPLPRQPQTPQRPDYTGQNLYTLDAPHSRVEMHTPFIGGGMFDPFALAAWARGIGQEFGLIQRKGDTSAQRGEAIAKGIAWTASQFLLHSLNPGDPQVGGALNRLYNPLHLPLAALPGIRPLPVGSPNLAAAASLDGNVYGKAALESPDRMLLMRQGAYQRVIGPADLLRGDIPTPQFLGDIAHDGGPRLPVNLPVSIEGQVDQTGPTAPFAQSIPIHKNLYTKDKPYTDGPIITQADIAKKIANPLSIPGLPVQTPEQVHLTALFGGYEAIQGATQPKYSWHAQGRKQKGAGWGVSATSFPDDIDVAFPGEQDGKVREANAIADSDNYMPFTFQDLRETPPTLMYFRAFLHEGLQETFSPNWNTENYYGRVDEVPTYQSTVRTVSFAFDVVAWSPKDLAPMYQKIHKLQSMVYPAYDSKGYMNAGPLVRLRVGDLICSKTGPKKGLPGYINTLSYAYDEIWNIEDNYRLPRKITVTLGFTIIHEGNPGIYPFSSINANAPSEPAVASPNGPNFGTLNPPNGLGVQSVSEGGVRGVTQTIRDEKIDEIGSDFDFA